jgi:hypothetical protein
MKKPLPVLVPLLLAIAMGSSIGATQDTLPDSDPFVWRPTATDRQDCQLPQGVSVSRIARAPYMAATGSRQLSVFKAELPNARLAFAASVFDPGKSVPTRPELVCVWHPDYSSYLRSSELVLGKTRHAVRIDAGNLTGEVEVAMIIGEVDGKPTALFSFRPKEMCPAGLEPCWNYSRTLNVMASRDKSLFYDLRVETKSWCTTKDKSKCQPESGPQELTTSTIYSFDGKVYRQR